MNPGVSGFDLLLPVGISQDPTVKLQEADVRRTTKLGRLARGGPLGTGRPTLRQRDRGPEVELGAVAQHVLPDRRAVNVFQNVGVFDFRPHISSDEIEHVLHPDRISRWRVFLKILPVGLDDRIVDAPDVAEFPASRIDAHCPRQFE